jgi:hypothetical protein
VASGALRCTFAVAVVVVMHLLLWDKKIRAVAGNAAAVFDITFWQSPDGWHPSN